jgi:hypothetical protein
MSTFICCFSEPQRSTLADAIKSLKQGVSRRLIGEAEHFWLKRYYDFNVRDYDQFLEKCDTFIAIQRNADCAGCPRTGSGGAFAAMQRDLKDASRSNPNGRRESGSGRLRPLVE